MNELITKILEKHRIQTNPKLLGVSDLEKAIIEICEAQKKECANTCTQRPTALCRWGNRITNFQLSTNDNKRTNV